jgi:hypothetical protein
MNDLSDSSDPQVAQGSATLSGNKEVVGGSDQQDTLRDATGEVAIPKEVVSAGVRVHPTVVPIPPRVSQMGVKPAGNNISTETATAVALPINDEVIAAGLGQGMSSSWRWLSEWCLRRMKQLHVIVKIVHGKLVRVTA